LFNTAGKQSIALDNFGGLITEAPPESLPEGASPLTYDCDFPIAAITSRPGLNTVLSSGQARNFVWLKSMRTLDGTIRTLCLDSAGQLWVENVTLAPGIISAVTNFTAGDYGSSCNAFNREYICLSDPPGSSPDTPWQYDGTNFDRISQEGPGANANYAVNATSNPNLANISSFSITSDVLTVICANAFSNGEIVQLQVPSISYLNGVVVTITAATTSQFTAAFTYPNVGSTSVTGTVTPLINFPITSITQAAQKSVAGSSLWSAGPGSMSAGTTLTIYYGPSSTPDPVLIAAFTAGIPVYVYINFGTGTSNGFVNGTYQVTSIGSGLPVQGSTINYFFTCQAPYSSYIARGAVIGATYQMTLGTVTLTNPAPNIVEGGSVNVQGATPTNWNNTWTVVQTPNGGVLNINATSLTGGVGSYTWTLVSGANPVVGDLVTVQNTTNGNGIFNVINATIATVVGSTFTVNGFVTTLTYGSQVETGQAQTFGRIFTIDPGPTYVGTTNQGSPIFGNDSGTGNVVVTNTVLNIGAGTRQAVVIFLTRNGYLTKPSPPVTFTTNESTASITATNIPIGPSNVIARWIAFTEAGANGVPGAFFYVIPQAVQTIVNGQPYTFNPTVVNDNVSTTATFVFTDAILLSSTEIDVPGNDLFSLRTLGNSCWTTQYANRVFYGLEQAKVDNFLNLSFNGGYNASPGSPLFPLGWTADATYGVNVQIVPSPNTFPGGGFGYALEINNPFGATQATTGMITQSASTDAYDAPILLQNVNYSVRVILSCSSGASGNLVIDLVTYDTNRGYGHSYGSATFPLSSASTTPKVFTAPLMSKQATVPTNLLLRVYCTNLTSGSAAYVGGVGKAIEIYDASQPTYSTQVAASYAGQAEAIDSVTGVVGLSQRNMQPVNGAFVMYDILYYLKSGSMYSTRDSAGDEPALWTIREVSNRVGTASIYSYDVGEEWMVTACREGVFIFTGGSPVKISQEIQQAWDLINWSAAYSIWTKIDIENRRILIGVPMSTPNTYLPNAPVNLNPTTPNVIFMLNYVGLNGPKDLEVGEQMHVTMFGTLVSTDKRRKWNIWQIPSPYAAFVVRGDGLSKPLLLGNGIGNGKIYELFPGLGSDDGTGIINATYTTYGFVNSGMSKQNPLLGFHRKLFTYMQMLAYGSGILQVKFLANSLNATANQQWNVLGNGSYGINLAGIPYHDIERAINIAGNRVFVQFSINAIGAQFSLSKLILVGGPHPMLPLHGSATW
jgi:hypothetical protein